MIGAAQLNEITKNKKIYVNDIAYIKFYGSANSKGSIEIILKEKNKSLSDMTEKERKDLFKLIDECKEFLDNRFDSDGYEINIGFKKHTKGKLENLCVSLVPRFENA